MTSQKSLRASLHMSHGNSIIALTEQEQAYGEQALKYHRGVIKALVVLYQKVINSASCGKWPLRAVDN